MGSVQVKSLHDIFLDGEFIFLQESKSLLLLNGSDSFKFINSISSNEVTNTKGSLSVSTLMLNNKGRLVFDVEVYSNTTDALFILCNHIQKDELIKYLENYRMSYKVDINDCSRKLYPFKGMNVTIPEKENKFPSALTLERDFMNYFLNNENIQQTKVFKVSELDYKKWKILSGSPSFPNELNTKLIPIEADMWSSISFTKGCYIGQETIARIKYRGKVKRTLGCFEIDGLVKDEREIQNIASNKVGFITSYFYSKEKVMTFAIGFINTVENFVGNEVKIGNLKGKVIINSYMKENMKLLEE